jgi:hypothetical protein
MCSIDPRRPSPVNSPTLWDMLELKAGAFLGAASKLAGLASFITATTMSHGKEDESFHEKRKLDDTLEDRAWLKPRMDGLREHLDVLGADVTMLSVSDAEEKIRYQWQHGAP